MKVCLVTLIAVACGLAGCSSGSNSFRRADEKPPVTQPEKNDAASQEETPESPESKPGTTPPPEPEPSPEPAPTPEPKPAVLALDARGLSMVPSAEGGNTFSPVKNETSGIVQYMSGPIHYNLSANTSDNKSLRDSTVAANVLASSTQIDPAQVQHVELTGDDGSVMGRFQFVNQAYSSYGTFMAAFNANPYAYADDEISKEALAFYVAQPTTIEQFNQQSGTATYTGHVLGYRDGVKGNTPQEQAVADINLNVDFAEKMISGRVVGNTRFDGLTKYHWRYTDDDDSPTQRGIALSKVDLILKPTKIVQFENGAVGFGGIPAEAPGEFPRSITDNVAVMDGDTEQTITQYGGIFAGPNAEEVVGQIGGGEDRLMFGASRR